jgi:hypothetical protein
MILAPWDYLLKADDGNTGKNSFPASWLWIGVTMLVMTRKASEAFTMGHLWKIFSIKSSRRIHSKVLI